MLPGRTVKGALSLTLRRLVSSALLVSGPLLWHIKPVVVIVMAGALHPFYTLVSLESAIQTSRR